ncbi:MAG: UDP-N-acetylmuramate--L-alanine ligase [Candidatus Moranbacteria bacterium RIFOXYA12_FULL_44_15]|nr:MAG: UDP-N-acetylmuramate--L-alanine ligase [Candidatus Moranbacteria bacterium RIFOXYA12_FULL_44_15]OGI36431.1 MAG: UDP-N-acetylmuramate--L-alanine ligase [Candidatus Moranbacteria bacterium RIFOXYA2_FULL_43_15]
MIAVVEILRSRGTEITGSDTPEKFFTDSILERLGIKFFEEFSESNIPGDVDLIIYSTAYNENNNVEFKYAKEKGLPMMSYPEILAGLFNEKYGIAVCGTHGKTTTSAMLANTLKECGVDPSAVIGSKVINWNGNALTGEGEFFVAETDEYQNKLDLYDSKAAILTSCDFDHPDFFKNFDDYKNVFKRFVGKIPKIGFLVVWGDSVDTLEVAACAKCEVVKYGFGEENDYKIFNFQLSQPKADPPLAEIFNEFSSSNVKISKPTQFFNISYGNKDLGRFEVRLAGKHNVLNAAAVVAACHKLNLDMEKVRLALKNFKGTSRRFEYIGERNGAILIDDYGHHPDEIKPTLQGARELYLDKTIWAVFHPHTFTRTKALLSEFSQSFDNADKVIVLDIYGSAREQQGGVHSKDLVDLINKYSHNKAEYIPTIDEAVEFLKDKIGGEDAVIAIGAGNVWEVVEKLKD